MLRDKLRVFVSRISPPLVRLSGAPHLNRRSSSMHGITVEDTVGTAINVFMVGSMAEDPNLSLRSKRFLGVREQRKTNEPYFARAKLGQEPK